ncbi:MAG: 3-isopropylmalate dehydratase small subunit [Cyclobacteriaceae bacterium]|nr:3-isopropylmalate dehydratase small subunit [Cyclobacteriaceae bacterium]MCH8516271.1 3-isopropylmalate dehydratase small subunit [Cyclobacteriaceae bacterium]
MQAINKIKDTWVNLKIDQVDTDQIFPGEFLKISTKEGLGKYAFYDRRYDENGEPNSDFVLNQYEKMPQVLVAGKNFGSGSSREHAVWCLKDLGFSVIIAPSFADIFKNNAYNNGLLVIELPQSRVASLWGKPQDSIVSISLADQTVSTDSWKASFAINAYKKECLLKGLDDIDYLLNIASEIASWEKEKGGDDNLN